MDCVCTPMCVSCRAGLTDGLGPARRESWQQTDGVAKVSSLSDQGDNH